MCPYLRSQMGNITIFVVIDCYWEEVTTKSIVNTLEREFIPQFVSKAMEKALKRNVYLLYVLLSVRN